MFNKFFPEPNFKKGVPKVYFVKQIQKLSTLFKKKEKAELDLSRKYFK
jgi:hypothetical protein